MLAVDLNPVDDVVGGVGGLVGGAAESAGEATLHLVSRFMFQLIADAVTSVTHAIVEAMSATTAIDLNGGFFPELTPIHPSWDTSDRTADHRDGRRSDPVERSIDSNCVDRKPRE